MRELANGWTVVGVSLLVAAVAACGNEDNGADTGGGGDAGDATGGSSSGGGSGGHVGGAAGEGGLGAGGGSAGGSAGSGGSAGGSGGSGSTVIQGSVNGQSLNAQEALLVLDTTIPGDELLVIQDSAGSCTQPDFTKFQGSVVLFADFVGVGAVSGPGVWQVGASEVFPEFMLLNAACQSAGSGFSVPAVGGSITLTAVDLSPGGSVQGTLSLDFGSTDHLSGAFSAAVCTTDYWSSSSCAP